ncbi:alpha/beta hydrolase [Kribbella solani]|uniref:alpha/beta hydrolase n=2 Tax=Kribbella solani TaxID=236067 RepID=UPI0029B9D735|nr:alpha/beta hydrolase [Kribbella solani]MDX3004008.1 alpha/beta hydrolase [Kribbella solani]
MPAYDELTERFRANHALLVAARDRLQAAVSAGTATGEQRTRLDTVNELLTSVTAAEVDAEGNVVEVRRPRQFLKVDPEGQGRAVEVLGELRQAKNVAVLVPGMGNSLDTFRGQADRGDLVRAEAGPGTAVIVWLDYDSPQGLAQAASKGAALDGGPRLAEFLHEVDELKAADAEVTLVAHSYGTDVAGEALINGARPARVVMTGSPGIRKYIDEAADFVPSPTRLYVERAPGDYVAYSEWHGPDPATFPDAVRMATNDPLANDEAVSVHWHNEYYRTNSEALRNIGRVVRGDLQAITTTATTRTTETELAPLTSWGTPFNHLAKTASEVYNGVVNLTHPHRHPTAPPNTPTAAPGTRAALPDAPAVPVPDDGVRQAGWSSAERVPGERESTARGAGVSRGGAHRDHQTGGRGR